MSRTSPQMHNLAERLVAHEASENGSSGTTHSPASLLIPEILRQPLASVVGTTGLRTLLSRALVLASADVPWLGVLHVKGDGSIGGLDDLKAKVDSAQMLTGRVALLTYLLELLGAFIGENLTLQLINDTWPKLPLNELQSESGEVNEREK